MGWGTNEKVIAKREKKDQQKLEQHREKTDKKEKQKWRDEETDRIMESANQKQQKRLKEIQRKRQLRQLVEREEQQMQKINAKKQSFAEKKLTQAEIAQNLQLQMLKSKAKQQNPIYLQNPNYQFAEYEIANNVEQALQNLDFALEKHPEKRYKAAYEAFCEKREPIIKMDYPKLKRSQRLQILNKQFQKSADNPYNKKIIAYNQKSYNAEEKMQKFDKKQEDDVA